MASLKEITTLCKAGQTQKAYDLCKTDLEKLLPWAQREMGWAMYYLIKEDTDKANYHLLVSHLNELKSLDTLSVEEDGFLFEQVLPKIRSVFFDER